MEWAVDDGKFLKSPCDNFFPPDDKGEREQDHTDIFEPHEIKAIFRNRGLSLELLNVMRKGDSINIARFTIGRRCWA